MTFFKNMFCKRSHLKLKVWIYAANMQKLSFHKFDPTENFHNKRYVVTRILKFDRELIQGCLICNNRQFKHKRSKLSNQQQKLTLSCHRMEIAEGMDRG